MTKPYRKNIRRMFLYIIITFIIMEILVGWIHEVGHAVACLAYGLEPEFQLVVIGNSYGWCDIQTMSQAFNIWLAGGSIAGTVAISSGFLLRKKYSWFYATMFAVGVGHFVRAIIEAGFHDFYLTQQGTTGQIISLIVGVVLILTVRQMIIMPIKTREETNEPKEV